MDGEQRFLDPAKQIFILFSGKNLIHLSVQINRHNWSTVTLISDTFLLVIYACSTEMFPWRSALCCRPLACFLGINSGHSYTSTYPS